MWIDPHDQSFRQGNSGLFPPSKEITRLPCHHICPGAIHTSFVRIMGSCMQGHDMGFALDEVYAKKSEGKILRKFTFEVSANFEDFTWTENDEIQKSHAQS